MYQSTEDDFLIIEKLMLILSNFVCLLFYSYQKCLVIRCELFKIKCNCDIKVEVGHGRVHTAENDYHVPSTVLERNPFHC